MIFRQTAVTTNANNNYKTNKITTIIIKPND